MNRVDVWLRQLKGGDCRVRVQGIANTRWLLDQLSRCFVFKTSEEMHEDYASSSFTFRVAYNSQMPRREFERLLAGIPQVRVMLEPA